MLNCFCFWQLVFFGVNVQRCYRSRIGNSKNQMAIESTISSSFWIFLPTIFFDTRFDEINPESNFTLKLSNVILSKKPTLHVCAFRLMKAYYWIKPFSTIESNHFLGRHFFHIPSLILRQTVRHLSPYRDISKQYESIAKTPFEKEVPWRIILRLKQKNQQPLKITDIIWMLNDNTLK